MACVYSYRNDSTGKITTYKTLPELVAANKDALWTEFVQSMRETNRVSKDFNWSGESAIAHFNDFIHTKFGLTSAVLKDLPQDEKEVTPDPVSIEEEELQAELEELANIAADTYTNFIEYDGLAKQFRGLSQPYNDVILKILNGRSFAQLSPSELDLVTIANSDLRNDMIAILAKLTQQGDKQEAISLANQVNDIFAVNGTSESMELDIDYLKESFDALSLEENSPSRGDLANGISAIQYDRDISGNMNGASARGEVNISELLDNDGVEELKTVLSLKVGDIIIAKYDRQHPQFDATSTDPLHVKVGLYKKVGNKEVKIGYLNEMEIKKGSATTAKVRDMLTEGDNADKGVAIRLTNVKDSNSNIWMPRQYTKDKVGAGNTLLSNVIVPVQKWNEKTKRFSKGKIRIARVSKNKGTKNILVDTKTGIPVDRRLKDRTNKFYVEVRTVGNNGVWVPVHNSTVGEASQLHEFGKHLGTEVAHRIKEHVIALQEYHSALQEREGLTAEDKNNEEIVQLHDDAVSETYNKANAAMANLNQLVAVGKFSDISGVSKSYYNYESNVKSLSRKFISSNSLITKDGNQISLDLKPGIIGSKVRIVLGSNIYEVDVNSSKFFTVAETIAAGMTRDIRVSEAGTFEHQGAVTIKLRGKNGDTGLTYKASSYSKYIEETGALLTDLGVIKETVKGKEQNLTNVNPAANSVFSMEFELANKERIGEEHSESFKKDYSITAQDFFFSHIDDTKLQEELKPLLRALEKTGVKILYTGISVTELAERTIKRLKAKGLYKAEDEETIMDNALRTVLQYNGDDNTIEVTENFIELCKKLETAKLDDNNEEEIANYREKILGHLMHESLHPVLTSSFSSSWVEGNRSIDAKTMNSFVNELDELAKFVKEQLHNVAPDNITQVTNWLNIVNKAITTSKKESGGSIYSVELEEVFTYAFTNKKIANALNNMNYGDVAIDGTRTLFQKLLDLLLKVLGINLKEDSTLAKVRDLIGKYYNSSTYWDNLKDSFGEDSNYKTPTRKAEAAKKEDDTNHPDREEDTQTTTTQQLFKVVNGLRALDLENLTPESFTDLTDYVASIVSMDKTMSDKMIKELQLVPRSSHVKAFVTILRSTLNKAGNYRQLLSYARLISQEDLYNETTLIGNLYAYVKGESSELSDNAINALKSLISNLNSTIELGFSETMDLDKETTPAEPSGFNIEKRVRRLLENAGDGYNNRIETGRGREAIENFNKEITKLGLPKVFEIEDDKLVVLDEPARIFNDVVSNTRYVDVFKLIVYHTESENGNLLNGLIPQQNVKSKNDKLILNNNDVHIEARVLGHMVHTAVFEAIDSVTRMNDLEGDIHSFETVPLGHIQYVIDYFGGREELNKVFSTRVTNLIDESGYDMGMIAALPMLESNTVSYVLGDEAYKTTIEVPSNRYNSSGFTEVVLQDVANSMVYFFGRIRRNSVLLYEKLFDENALIDGKMAVKDEITNSIAAILNFYENKLKSDPNNKMLATYITNLTKVYTDLTYEDSEVWDRFLAYITKELDVAEESTVTLDKILSGAEQGRGTLFGKMRIQSKSTVSSNIKHLLWGNIIIRDKTSAIDNAKSVISADEQFANLLSMLNNDLVEVSHVTGLPVTMSAGEVRDVMISTCGKAANRADFINRLEDVSEEFPTILPIVHEVTKQGNDALLRKLYTALKLQSPLYIVPSIQSYYEEDVLNSRLRFDIANPDVDPAMSIASDINNYLTGFARYKDVADLTNKVAMLSKLNARLYKAIDKKMSSATVASVISNALKVLNNSTFKYNSKGALEKVLNKDLDFASNMVKLIDSYIDELVTAISAKENHAKNKVKGKKHADIPTFKTYSKFGIDTFKGFNRVPYYFTLDSYFTTVDLSTAYSNQLPSYFTELMDRFNNDKELLLFGKELAQDKSVAYNRMFNTMFTFKHNPKTGNISNVQINTNGKKLLGNFKYALMSGMVNKSLNHRIEYESLIGKDWLYTQMIDYLGDYTIMNSNADSSRMYGIHVPGNKFKLFASDFAVIDKLMKTKTSDPSVNAAYMETPAFKLIRNVMLSELQSMLDFRNAAFEQNKVNGKLTIKDGIDIHSLIEGLHKDNFELLKNGVATGRIFKFDSLKLTTKKGKVTFDQWLKKKGINLMVKGVPLFPSEHIGTVDTISIEDLFNQVENGELLDAINEYVVEFTKSMIADRMTKIDQIKDKLLKVKDIPMSEVNDYYSNNYDSIINTELNSVDKWAYSFIIDELLSNFDWNKLIKGDSIEYSRAINQGKRMNHDTRPGSAVLSDALTRTITFSDYSSTSNLLSKIEERVPDSAKYYTGKQGIKNEAATDGITIMSRKGAERFFNEQGVLDKYEKFFEALDNEDYTSDAYKYGIQSLKTFYYDRMVKDFGNGYKKLISEQVKHSIFVMNDQFAFTPDMRRMLSFMDKHNLDMINFGSTEKVGLSSMLDVYNEDGTLIDIESMSEEDVNKYVTTRRVDKYRTQLELPQHSVDYQGKVATQLKRQFENLRFNERIYNIEGVKFTGKELFTMYQSLFSNNIEEESIALYEELGVDLIDGKPIIDPKTGLYQIDITSLYSFINDFVRVYYNDANIMDAIELNERGVPKLPPFFTTIANRIQQRVIARVRDKVLQQRQVGAHAAIVANAFRGGIVTDMDNVDPDKITFRSDYIRDRTNTNLEIKEKEFIQKDGSKVMKLVAETIISVPNSMFLKDGKQLNIDDLFEADPKMLQMLAHRIPLEGEQSMIIIDIVGIINDGASHIILPDDVAVKSGADFDIDTEYLMGFNLEYHEGKLRTIPYYDKLTAENEDYLYHKYVNAKLEVIVRDNIQRLKTNVEQSIQANIRVDSEMTTNKLNALTSELKEFGIAESNFNSLDSTTKKIFKDLEVKFRQRGLVSIDKFLEYRDVVGTMIQVAAAARTIEDINTTKILDGYINDDIKTALTSYFNHIRSLAEVSNPTTIGGTRYDRAANAMFNLFNEYEIAHKLYTTNYEQELGLLKSDLKDIKSKNWATFRERLTASKNALYEKVLPREEFRKLPIDKINSKLARQNMLLDITSSIITNDAHFGTVMKVNEMADAERAANKVNSLWGHDLTQLDHNNGNDRNTIKTLQSSAKVLKGISVATDRLLSILRPVNGQFANDIVKVPILKKEAEEAGWNIKKLQDVYGEGNVYVSRDNKYYLLTVTHLANRPTLDGKTIHGTDIFAHISEATAHMFDSASRPTSMNQNEYTIGVYKLLSVSGITHMMETEEGMKESAYIYADMFINHPAIVELANEYIERRGPAASYHQSVKTSTIIKELENKYFDELYELVVKGKNKTTFDLVENTKEFKLNSLNKDQRNTLINQLQSMLTDNQGKSISLSLEIPTIEQIADDIKLEVSGKDKIKAIANKFAYLPHWQAIHEVSNHVTQLTNILKTDGLNLNESEIIMLDRNIGDATFNYDKLLEELYRVNSNVSRFNNVREELERFKNLSLRDQLYTMENTYKSYGVKFNSLYKFKSGNDNLLLHMLPSAFDSNIESKYKSLDAFYKYGVKLAKSISNVMMAHRYPGSQLILNSIFKGATIDESSYKAAVNWFNGWLASSSKIADLSVEEKNRIMSHSMDSRKILVEHVTADEIKIQSYFTQYERTLKDGYEGVEKIELDKEAIDKLGFTKKLAILNSDTVLSNRYKFASNLSKIRRQSNKKDDILQLIFAHNMQPADVQKEVLAMYYDKKTPLLASIVKDLFKFAFLNDGLMYGNKITKFLPLQLLTTKDFTDEGFTFGELLTNESNRLLNIAEAKIKGIPQIRRKFHQSNWDNYAFVPRVKANSDKAVAKFKHVGMIAEQSVDNIKYFDKIIVADKDDINNSNLAARDYILLERKDGTTGLYERVEQTISQFTRDVPYYFYIELEKRDKFEYNDTFISSNKVNYDSTGNVTIDDLIEKVYNGDLNIPVEENNRSMRSPSSAAFRSRKVLSSETTPFTVLPNDIQISDVHEEKYYNMYSLTHAATKHELEGIVAKNADISFVLEDEVDTYGSSKLFDHINAVTLGNTVQLTLEDQGELDTKEFNEKLLSKIVDTINNRVKKGDTVTISIHGVSHPSKLDESGLPTGRSMIGLANALYLLPKSNVNEITNAKSDALTSNVKIIMANNSNVASPIVTYLNAKYSLESAKYNTNNVVEANVLFGAYYNTYGSGGVTTNNTDEYTLNGGQVSNITESMNIDEINKTIAIIDDNINILKSVNPDTLVATTQLMQHQVDNVIATTTIIKNENPKFVPSVDYSDRSEGGTDMHARILPAVEMILNNEEFYEGPNEIANLLNAGYESLIEDNVISSDITAFDYSSLVLRIVDRIRENRILDKLSEHTATINKVYTEFSTSSINYKTKQGIVGSIDIMDLGANGATQYDLKLSVASTVPSDYVTGFDTETMGTRRKHAMQAALYEREMEKPAILKTKDGVPIKAPTIYTHAMYVIPIRMELSEYTAEGRAKITKLELEPLIDLNRTNDLVHARTFARSTAILPLSESEKVLFKAREDLFSLTSIMAAQEKASMVSKRLASALISLSKIYNNEDERELNQRLNALLPEIINDNTNLLKSAGLTYVINILDNFASFANDTLSDLINQANLYDSNAISMRNIVKDSNSDYQFVRTMNLMNRVMALVSETTDMIKFDTSRMDHPQVKQLFGEFNNTVDALYKVQEQKSVLNSMYDTFLKEYMLEKIALHSRNPLVQPFLSRKKNGKLDLVKGAPLFNFEDINASELWVYSRHDTGIPFDDAISTSEINLDTAYKRERKNQEHIFFNLLGAAYKDNKRWRYTDTIANSREITKWFKDTFIAKDYEGKDTGYLVTAHNNHIFYNEYIKVRDRVSMKIKTILNTRDDEHARINELAKDVDNNKYTAKELNALRVAANTKYAEDYNTERKELDKFLAEYADPDYNHILIDVGDTMKSVNVGEYVREHTADMNNQQRNIFLKQHGIDRGINGNYVAIRPKEYSIQNKDNIPSNEQFKRIMANPKLKAFYDYISNIKDDLLSFNSGLILDPTKLPIMQGDLRTNWESINRAFLGGNKHIDTSYPIQDVTGSLTYALKAPLLGMLFGERRIKYRNKRAGETLEEYREKMVAFVNQEYDKSFKSLDEIKAYTNAQLAENSAKTVEKMQFNPHKLYTTFIELALTYQEKSKKEQEYTMYLDFIKRDARVFKLKGGKPQLDQGWREANLEDKWLTDNADSTNLSKLVESYRRNKLYGIDDNRLSANAEKIIKALTQYTSLRVMAFNLRNGIKNFNKGMVDILTEAIAGQFIDKKSLRKGFASYNSGVMDILSTMGTEEADTLAGAFIKDHNDLLEKQTESGLDIKRDIQNVVDRLLVGVEAAYFFNNSGEHAMQYGMYLSMLHSHRIVNGVIMSQSDYVGNYAHDLLKANLPAEVLEDFKKYEDKQKESTIRIFEERDYFGKWIVRSTMLQNNRELLRQIKDIYINQYHTKRKSLIAEFNKNMTVYDAHEIKDHMLAKREGIVINEGEMTRLKRRTRVVNHSLHGIYNKLDSNKMQASIGLGSLMQFRRWMPANWNRIFGKRFNRALWNPSLGVFQKPSASAVATMFFRPIREYYQLDKESRAMSQLFKGAFNYITNFKTMYRSASELDKQGFRRFVANFTALAAVIGIAALIRSKTDDDWIKESKGNEILYGMMMYEFTSLSTELSEFSPIGGWSSIMQRFADYPAPIMKTVVDIFKFVSFLAGDIGSVVGIGYNSTYQSGPKKGWNKTMLQLLSLTPIAREYYNWTNIMNIVEYYKMYDPIGAMKMYEFLTATGQYAK